MEGKEKQKKLYIFLTFINTINTEVYYYYIVSQFITIMPLYKSNECAALSPVAPAPSGR